MNTSCDYRARMAYGEPFQTSAAFHPPNCSYPTVHTGNIMSGSIKRKRSDSELSFSSSTPLSSPLRPAQDSTYMAPILSWHDLAPPMLRGSSAPSQVTSRTLKRHRNSRPPEEEVHEYTLRLLYQAQQKVRQEQLTKSGQTVCLNSEISGINEAVITNEDGSLYGFGHVDADQPSLHSFWKTSLQLSSSSS